MSIRSMRRARARRDAGFTKRTRRIAGVGGLATALAAAAALSTSAPAMAAGSYDGYSSISASGSSIQYAVQQALTGSNGYLSWGSSNLSNSPLPTITYTATSSGHCLTEFGDVTGAFDRTESGNGSSFDEFCGSDDPPTPTEISDAESAAGSSIKEINFPVLQAAVTVDFSLPAGVTLASSQKLDLTNKLLDEVWTKTVPAGTTAPPTDTADQYPANTWGALLEAVGYTPVSGTPSTGEFEETGTAAGADGGYTPITLQARSAGSGTTFTFRSYLNEVESLEYGSSYSSYTYNDGDVSDTDAEATSTSGGWPVAVNEDSASETGADLAQVTAQNPGSVTYANLADVLSTGYTNEPTDYSTDSSEHQILYAQVQNNGVSTSGATFAEPSSDASDPSDGGANVYTGGTLNEAAHAVGARSDGGDGYWTVPTVEDGSWAGTPDWGEDPYNTANGEAPQQGEVAAADDPNVANDAKSASGDYPISAATYDLAWSSYSGDVATQLEDYDSVPSGDMTEVGNTVSDYFDYVFSADGQDVIADSSPSTDDDPGYAGLPSGLTTVKEDQVDKLPGQWNG